MWSMDFNANSTLSVPAFTDSVGDTGDFNLTICGEKKITLDEGTPSFLTLTYGNDTIIDNFSINYDQATATESDLTIIHTVQYTVVFKEYEDNNPNTSYSSFGFQILCPDTFIEDDYEVNVSINLLNDTTVSWALPTISNIPENCYSLTFDQLFSSSTNETLSLSDALSDGSISFSATNITLSHSIASFDDRKAIFDAGPSFYFIGDVTGPNIAPSTKTNLTSFSIDITDACRDATISPQELNVPEAVVVWDTDTNVNLSKPAHTDTVDETYDYYIGICGEKRLTLELVNTTMILNIYPGDSAVDNFTISYD